eukprot:2209336-Rhodomonas_salina.2
MVNALRQSVVAGSAEDADPAYFGYCGFMGKFQDIVAASVQKYRGLSMEAQDCFVTNCQCAISGMVASLLTLTDPGDYVLIMMIKPFIVS